MRACVQRTTETDTSADTSGSEPMHLTVAAGSGSTTREGLPRLQEYIQSIGKNLVVLCIFGVTSYTYLILFLRAMISNRGFPRSLEHQQVVTWGLAGAARL